MKELIYQALATILACSYAVAGAPHAETEYSSPTLQLSNDTSFNSDLLVALQNARTGAADVGAVLGAARDIIPGDFDAYLKEFYDLANATKTEAVDPNNAFNGLNVRDTWFSASQYFRRADVYIHRNWSNPLIDALWAEQTVAFDKAIAALPVPGQRVRIPSPGNNFTVEAIWYAASKQSKNKLPTMIVGNGFDAAQEDSYHYYCADALTRGWNCITYEGPGQNTVRRTQGLGFIHEWEQVATPVVDYLLSEKKQAVDENCVVLVGNSLGGYFAARAAAFEPRLSAVVLVGGVWDLYSGYSTQLPKSLLATYQAGNYARFDNEVLTLRDAGNLPTEAIWGLDYGLWAFKTHSPSEFFDLCKQYTVKDFIQQIQIPVFVGDAEFETIFKGQARKVKDALGEYGTYHEFKGVAGYHCQSGAQQELARTIFAWLNKALAVADADGLRECEVQ